MAYTMYLDGELMPVTPSKIELKVNNQNETLTLIDGTEINLLRLPGLSEASFELLLPQVSYPFADGAQSADYYLELLERLKTGKKPFQWVVNRHLPKGTQLFYTDLTVSLEDYEITDDAEQGFDITVKVNLKQYKHYSTKTVTLQPPETPSDPPEVTVDSDRDDSSAPQVTTYTVVAGDCMWNIARKFYGDGTKYTVIEEANQELLADRIPHLIYAGDVLTIPEL